MADQKICNWCKDDERPVAYTGLCSRCYRLKLKLKKAELGSQNATPRNASVAELRLKIAKRMIDLAKWEGDCFGEIDSKDIDGHWLELAFRFFSRRTVGKEMFFGHATIFDHEFTPEQRRLIFAYLARMERQRLVRRRHFVAGNTADLESDWQQYV